MVRPRQRDAQARAGRLVHLAEDHRQLVEHAGALHFLVEVVALAGALTHAGEDRETADLASAIRPSALTAPPSRS